MYTDPRNSLVKRVKTLLIGRERNIQETGLFRKISLIAFFAWVGLGADGLSSSAYGPEEAFLALGEHVFLGIFVALASAFTIFVISNSYSQIIELFPNGGGGYLVASKLLSPTFGMISGCALIIDYVLTITISVAAGAAAIFSFLPEEWLPYTLLFALFGVAFLMMLNLRGVRESVLLLAPVFLMFIITHIIIIIYAMIVHFSDFPGLVGSAKGDIGAAYVELGILGMFFLVMKAYSFGAGTYTGIEAVSNGLSILREPRVKTAKRTMLYMASSLAFMAVGLMIAYLFYSVEHVPGKTLNAVLYSTVTESWGSAGYIFLIVSLISEAALLFIASQAGFIGGPRVLADMALGRWF
ncbi:MAG: amino acid permease, partial [Nanoarchaeota archaeon]